MCGGTRCHRWVLQPRLLTGALGISSVTGGVTGMTVVAHFEIGEALQNQDSLLAELLFRSIGHSENRVSGVNHAGDIEALPLTGCSP